jgi:hypothetical protein
MRLQQLHTNFGPRQSRWVYDRGRLILPAAVTEPQTPARAVMFGPWGLATLNNAGAGPEVRNAAIGFRYSMAAEYL